MSEDSLEPLVTQCPNCDTRFRVTETQLQVASGRVRCGACLAVFEGTAHLTLDGEHVVTEGEPDVDALLDEIDEVTQGEPGQATALPVIADDELAAVSADDLAEEADDEVALPDELLALEAAFLDELRVGEAASTKPAAAADADAGEAAEASADTLDEAIAEPFGIEVAETDVTETEVAATDASAAEASETDEADAVAADKAVGEADKVADADDTAAADHDARNLAEGGDARPAGEEDEEDSDWLDEVAADVWEDSGERVEDEDAAVADLEPTAAAGEVSAVADKGVIELQAINDEALGPPTAKLSDYATADAFPEEYAEPSRQRSWVTLTLMLLALIALPAQVLWFQYDAWVMDTAYRPVYQTICNVAGCELPALRDVSQIASKRSFIRAHPEREDARIVDVLMVNNADFAQPYPLIELKATSLNGQLVAGRRFKPDEYLQGEASAAELLPPRTPVHVSLEIQDPAKEALNFEVHFR